MDVILYILIGLFIVVIFGCIMFAYLETIENYLVYGVSDMYDKYNVTIVDTTDINYIKKIVPETLFRDTINQIAGSDIKKCPNGAIPDEIFLKDSNKKYGNETPWDKDIVPCEIVNNKDRDLYKNVLDNNMITIY